MASRLSHISWAGQSWPTCIFCDAEIFEKMILAVYVSLKSQFSVPVRSCMGSGLLVSPYIYPETPHSLNVRFMSAFHTAQFVSLRGSNIRVIVTLLLAGMRLIDNVDGTALPDVGLSVDMPPLAPPSVLAMLALFDMFTVNRG